MGGCPEKAVGFTGREGRRQVDEDEVGEDTGVRKHILYNAGLFLELLEQ